MELITSFTILKWEYHQFNTCFEWIHATSKSIGTNINFDIHLPYFSTLFIFLKGEKGCFNLRTIISSCIFFCFLQNPHIGNGYNSNHSNHLEHFDHNGHLRWWWWTFWQGSQWSSSSHWMSFSLVCKNLSKILIWQNLQD